MKDEKIQLKGRGLFGLSLGACAVLALLLLVGLPQTSSAASSVGIMVPLYGTAGNEWDPVIRARTDHPSVPIVAIINKDAVLASVKHPDYVTLTERLHSAGITVLGYTYAVYGTRDINEVKAEIDNYRDWYNVDGIFVDQMSYEGGDEYYYSDITSYAKSTGLTLVVGNPGTETRPSYVGTVDTIIIHENPGYPSISYLGGWHANYDKKNWGILPYETDYLDKPYVVSASEYLGYIYISADPDPEPWARTPPYFADLVSTLDPGSGSGSSHIKVSSQDGAGNTLAGFYTELHSQDGTLLDSGYTPYSFTINNDQIHTVQADLGYGEYHFDHWSDTGSANYSRVISAPSDVSITAVYTTTSLSAPTGLTATAVSPSQINLGWTAPSGSSTASGYKIERSMDNGSTWSVLVSNTGSQSTAYSDTGLDSNTTYTYRVSAISPGSTSSPSNTASVTTPDTQPPPTTAVISVSSADSSGATIEGMWVELWQNGAIIQQGPTPFSANASTGTQHQIFMDNWNGITFVRWEDGSTNPTRTITPTQDATLTAFFTGTARANGIVLDTVQSTSGAASNDIMLSGFDAGTGANRLLVVGISANNNDVASVTFGGVALTQAASTFVNNDAEFWYLTNPSGTGDIIVTMNGPTDVVVGAYSFSGVDQTDPIPTKVIKHSTTPNSPKISITTKYQNSLVLDLPSIYGGSTLSLPTCTNEWDITMPGAITGASSSAVVPSPGLVSCGWTASGADFWDDVAIELRASQ